MPVIRKILIDGIVDLILRFIFIKNYFKIILLLIILSACRTSKPLSEDSSKKNLQSFFINLPDSAFKKNFLPYNMDFKKEDRKKLLIKELQFTDFIIYKNNLMIIQQGDITPYAMNLRLLSKNKFYSLTMFSYGELWTNSEFHVFRCIRKSYLDCTKKVMPNISLTDFIHDRHLDKFSADFINNPTLIYAYQNDYNDTLKVTFEPEDHPFFESIDSDSVIKSKSIYLVWKKNKFVKIK